MEKAIGYIRVSTDGQVGSGLSLEAQRAKIQAYATLKDLELVEIIEDAGISAKNMNRPGLKRLLALARAKKIQAVIIFKLDRMFRNTVDALETALELDKRGVALHSISESFDTHSAIGKFFFTILASLAEMERGIIAERTRIALAQKKERGEKTGGDVPFGKELANGELVDNPEEQKTLEDMRTLRASGASYQNIANALNARQIRTKTGKMWSRDRVFKILKNAA